MPLLPSQFRPDFGIAFVNASMKLSAVMPAYNEGTTLRQIVERVLAVLLDIELLCVDDGSWDESRNSSRTWERAITNPGISATSKISGRVQQFEGASTRRQEILF